MASMRLNVQFRNLKNLSRGKSKVKKDEAWVRCFTLAHFPFQFLAYGLHGVSIHATTPDSIHGSCLQLVCRILILMKSQNLMKMRTLGTQKQEH